MLDRTIPIRFVDCRNIELSTIGGNERPLERVNSSWNYVGIALVVFFRKNSKGRVSCQCFEIRSINECYTGIIRKSMSSLSVGNYSFVIKWKKRKLTFASKKLIANVINQFDVIGNNIF